MNKAIVVPAGEDLWAWINKGKKEMKIKSTAEFVRMGLEHLRNSGEMVELKRKMEKTHVERMLKEASEKAEAAARLKEELERRLEKILA